MIDHGASPNRDDDPFRGTMPIRVALDQLRLRLLDLTGRNRLINFRHSAGKSLQFVNSSVDGIFRRLTGDSPGKVTITALPEPGRTEWVLIAGRLVRPEAKAYATGLGINPSYDLAPMGTRELTTPLSGTQLRTLFYSEDLGKHCRKLDRDAKLAIEETGANMLFLVFGFLEYPEMPSSEKMFRAPLVCVPVSVTRSEAAQYTTFHLNWTGDELVDNPPLREKLKRDFGLNLPGYDTEEASSIEAYFDEVTDAIADMPNWRVRRMITLTLLSFSNMLLVRDLDPKNWPTVNGSSKLVNHGVVRQVIEGRALEGDANYADEYLIDDHPQADLALVFDADTSQHSALIDVLEGHNRVIEGPPGTGKSQTITNLIAAAMKTGKTVLFVAEKLAALQVVKTRLTQAGLEHFVLELHSNKTSKKRVIEDISKRINIRIKEPTELRDKLQILEEKRLALKQYADLLNSREGNRCNLTLHQVLWRAERNRIACGENADRIQQIKFPAATRYSNADFTKASDSLGYLAEQFEAIGVFGPAHPFWGFLPKEFTPEDSAPIRHILRSAAEKFDEFAVALRGIASMSKLEHLTLGMEGSRRLLKALTGVAPPTDEKRDLELLPTLFTEIDVEAKGAAAALNEILEMLRQLKALRAEVRGVLNEVRSPSTEDASRALSHLQRLRALGLEDDTASALRAIANELSAAMDDATNVLRSLERISALMGIEFAGAGDDIRRLLAVHECVRTAPVEHFHLRSAPLLEPRARKTLCDLRDQRIAIRAEEVRISKRLYVDLLPERGRLEEAIITLRNGDAWYRVFQTSWRRAIQLHRGLERQKSRTASGERLQELESLLAFQSRKRSWNDSAELRQLAGSHFSGETTPLDQLIAVAGWIETVGSAREEWGLSANVLDCLAVDKETLGQLKRATAEVEALVAVLLRSESRVLGALAAANESVKKTFAECAWPARVQLVRNLVLSLDQVITDLESFAKDGASARQGLEGIVGGSKIPEMTRAVSDHHGAKTILGARFRGEDTDLESAFAVLNYGRLIKKSGLPSGIERALLSNKCLERHAEASAYASSVVKGWETLEDFSAKMRRFGEFDIDAWAAVDRRSDIGYIDGIGKRTHLAVAGLEKLLPWAQYVMWRKDVIETGLGEFVDALELGGLPSAKVKEGFGYRFYSSIAQAAFEQTKTLRQFSGTRHSSIRRDFAQIDREVIRLRGQQVAKMHQDLATPPRGQASARVDEKTELELIHHLIPQQKPRVPVRKLLKRAGRAVQALKPCFMMGPQAVAQFLEPGHLDFDIVVMDEASQLKPEEAIGAIARGKQLVVVGDPKQLPPTTFFSKMAQQEEDEEGLGQTATADSESILDVCMGHFQPIRSLRWHYRSHHESLIAFSNHYFYGGKLVVFPSPYPRSRALGVRYHHVPDGFYESQMNQVEARRVVDAAVDHIRKRGTDSLGIATLNLRQRDLIAEMLDSELRSIPEAHEFQQRWEGEGMGLFVKNLENVQGDERDCIIIGTTFGKAPGTTVVRQNFGPISRDGGWRRLNVLFTRARKSVTVFSSMRAEDIVVDSSTPAGTRALRNYLEYAKTGVLPVERETGVEPESDFEVAVIDTLRLRGYDAVPQLGVAGFRIDIGVRYPGHGSGYLAAIECDGASYHTGVSVRDRDRIRQQILESLGWQGRIWRIWSADWFRNPRGEAERMFAFLEQLKLQPLPNLLQGGDEGVEGEKRVTPSVPIGEPPADTLVISSDDQDWEIEVGDLVTYSPVIDPTREYTVRITSNQNDPNLGLIAENTPLASALLGATAGETVVLRVPGRDPQSFLVRKIKRISH